MDSHWKWFCGIPYLGRVTLNVTKVINADLLGKTLKSDSMRVDSDRRSQVSLLLKRFKLHKRHLVLGKHQSLVYVLGPF